jgi:hypothetical protein
VNATPRDNALLVGLVALAIALGAGLFFVSGAVRDVRRAADQVTVTGSARRPIRSDFVVWRGTVATQAGTLAEASRELTAHAEQVRRFLNAQGIVDSLLTVRPVEAFPIPEVLGDGRQTGRTVAYRVSQLFEIRSADVDGMTRLALRTGELIASGVPLQTAPPEYLFTKLPELRVQLLADATRDARARAEAIAEAAGGRVGAVRDVRMGVFQITPRFSTEVSDYGINDVTSLDKDVTAVVRVSFAVR